MRLAPYQSYKPSGVDWLGEVPEHWEVKRLKWTAKGIVNGVWGDEPNEVDDLICVRVADFDRERLRVHPSPPTLRAIDPRQRDDRLLHKNDLLIEKSGGGDKQLVGCVVLFDHEYEAVCSNFVARMPITRGQHARFWVYAHAALYAGRVNYPAIKQTTGIQNLDSSAYLDTCLAFPPDPEQQAIASFLERKTATIDALVAKKRTFIERLKEKRTALISRTVTRGLPPDAAIKAGFNPHPNLKPSGIDWLGEVPEHWEVLSLKNLVSTPVTDGPHETPEILEEGVPFVSAEAISEGRINIESIRGYISLEDHRRYSKKYKPRLGDIYIVKSGATTGRVAMVETEKEFNIWSPLAAIRCDPRRANRYFMFSYLQSQEFQTAVQLSWSFGTQQNIGMGVIQNLAVPIPSLSEQTAIANFLLSASKQTESMIARVETAIIRLQEYRTALITAAVTGKIDVRGAL